MRNCLGPLAIFLCLTLLTGFHSPTAFAADPSSVNTYRPECQQVGDGAASCQFYCGRDATLTISVSTSDQSFNIPEVTGRVQCSGVTVDCPETTGTCRGYSPERTAQPGTAACSGESDEPWWSTDDLHITCHTSEAHPRYSGTKVDGSGMTVPDLSYPDMGWRTNEIEMHVTGGKLVVAYYRIYVDGELISATTWSPGTA